MMKKYFRVKFIDMPSAEVMKFIISGDVTSFGNNEYLNNLQNYDKK